MAPYFFYQMPGHLVFLARITYLVLNRNKHLIETGITHAHAHGGKQLLPKHWLVKGHHVYKDFWTPWVGEKLMVECEHDTEYDVNAVVGKKDSVIVAHLPQVISRISWLFLKRGGHIVCRGRGKWRHRDGVHFPLHCHPRSCNLLRGYSATPLSFKETLRLMHKTLSTFPAYISNRKSLAFNGENPVYSPATICRVCQCTCNLGELIKPFKPVGYSVLSHWLWCMSATF